VTVETEETTVIRGRESGVAPQRIPGAEVRDSPPSKTAGEGAEVRGKDRGKQA
jgi:hypothetical protein